MTPGASKSLELNKILVALESFALTPMGSERARSLAPSVDIDTVRTKLTETTEGKQLAAKGIALALPETPDVRRHLEILPVAHRSLDVAGLLELARLARHAAEIRAGFRQTKDTEIRTMRVAKIADRLPDLSRLTGAIDKAIDRDSGEIKDSASPELRSLRARLFKLTRRLDGILESYFKQKDSRKILQDELITVRNGRSVLPVKSECRAQLVGIVHGASASGATVFIEPLNTVEVNNDIVAVREKEQQEIARILLALTDAARERIDDLARTVDIIGALDLIQAKAKLSDAYDGSEPAVNDGKSLKLVAACHPLLLGDVVARIDEPAPAREAVPITFKVDAQRSALVFTGPNTGGKTVALKTAGLLSLMVQAGLHVPAHPDSSFPLFKHVFADIGDEQSIGSSLSTFSSHLKNIVQMERALQEPSLVLLDEVGTGTDPEEGGALGTALVDHFRRRGALVLASTHHGMLKAYASTTPGVGSASFEFDPMTYEPTYRLVEGSTGRSLALEIAGRFGLPREVITHARQLQSQKERQVEDLLDRLEGERRDLSREREKLAHRHRVLEASIRRQTEMEEEYARDKDRRMHDLQQEIETQVSRAREELDAILAEARQQAVLPEGKSRTEVRRSAKMRVDEIAAGFEPPPSEIEPARPAFDVRVGMKVLVTSLQLSGDVVEVLGPEEVEVSVRDKKLRIPIFELEPAAPGPLAAKSTRPSVADPTWVVRSELADAKRTPHELNVIGCTVDEALSQADKFLDDAFLSDHQKVRLIHGHGKGRLKKAIDQWLATHPHVAKHQPEGGGAVTLVELKS